MKILRREMRMSVFYRRLARQPPCCQGNLSERGIKAAPGLEPGVKDLQSSALATWLCRPFFTSNNMVDRRVRIKPLCSFALLWFGVVLREGIGHRASPLYSGAVAWGSPIERFSVGVCRGAADRRRAQVLPVRMRGYRREGRRPGQRCWVSFGLGSPLLERRSRR